MSMMDIREDNPLAFPHASRNARLQTNQFAPTCFNHFISTLASHQTWPIGRHVHYVMISGFRSRAEIPELVEVFVFQHN